MTIFAELFFGLWCICHLEQNGGNLEFLKMDSWGFFSQNLHTRGQSGQISALFYFFAGLGNF